MGPIAYENWKAILGGAEVTRTEEYPLYTDARVVGELVDSLGPYKLLNGLSWSPPDQYGATPAIVLRSQVTDTDGPPSSQWTSDYDRYHGGDLPDEIAALVSLTLGIRAMAGDRMRTFEPGKDPLGTPEGYLASGRPELLRLRGSIATQFVLPWHSGHRDLADASRMSSFIRLQPGDATALMRAARFYQNAVWTAESEPEIAWLLLVSAVETAAVRWSRTEEEPIDRLKTSKPELYDVLMQAGGEAHTERVAGLIAQSLGVGSLFRRFLLEREHMPEAPSQRPAEHEQVGWEPDAMETALKKVYDHRSKALHEARPFPYPMCSVPRPSGGGGVPIEKPFLHAARALGATWMSKDCPMHLHVFAYIAHGALLNWWASLVPSDSVAEQPEPPQNAPRCPDTGSGDAGARYDARNRLRGL